MVKKGDDFMWSHNHFFKNYKQNHFFMWSHNQILRIINYFMIAKIIKLIFH
jgi:hypothetical protein